MVLMEILGAVTGAIRIANTSDLVGTGGGSATGGSAGRLVLDYEPPVVGGIGGCYLNANS